MPDGEQELLARQCLKRRLTPEELTRVVLFFTANDNGIYIKILMICHRRVVQLGC